MAIALEKFSTAGPAGLIEGVVHGPDEIACAIAVVAHPLPTMGGTMENKVAVTLARTFAELDCVTLRFNFRGVGGVKVNLPAATARSRTCSRSCASHRSSSAKSCP